MSKFFLIILISSALLIGFLYIGPQVFIWRNTEKAGGHYLVSQYTIETNELEMDLPRAREIYDGHFPPSELFLDKSGPTPLTPFSVFLLSLPMFLFAGNINMAYLTSQFIFSALIFLSFYLVGWVITKHRLWSIFLAFVGVLTPMARYLPRGFFSFDNFSNLVMKNFYPSVKSPLEFIFLHKIVDPLITYLIYLPAIAMIICFWKKPRKSTAILAGLLIGLMFYTYFHYWVYLIIAAGFLGIYSLWTRRSYPARFKYFLALAAVITIFAVPYFVNYFLFQNLPGAADVVDRQGVVESGRYFRIQGVIKDYIFYAILAAIVYLIFWNHQEEKKKELAKLFWAFILAIFIAWNIQLVTGYTLVANHWILAFSPPALIILFSVTRELASRFKKQNIVKLMLVVLIILLIVKKAVNVAFFMEPNQDLINRYSFNHGIVTTWEWMDGNLPSEPKIISPLIMDSVYLSIYTSTRSYLPFYTNTLASNAELERRFLISQKLFGVSRDNLEKQLRWTVKTRDDCEFLKTYYQKPKLVCDAYTRYSFENGRFLYGFTYLPANFHTLGSIEPSWDIPEAKIQELLARYDNLEARWQDLKADYVYYSAWAKNLSEVDLSQDKGLELVYQNNNVNIYRIRHE